MIAAYWFIAGAISVALAAIGANNDNHHFWLILAVLTAIFTALGYAL